MSLVKHNLLARAFGLYFPGLRSAITPHVKAVLSARGRPKADSVPAQTAVPPLNRQAFIAFLTELGVKPGDTLMVHSSWAPWAASGISMADFIGALRDAIGPEGTLCMPAFPILDENSAHLSFSVKRTPSNTGLVTEAFRRMEGVHRSCQFRSVAALGPRAELLIGEHHLSPYPCGPASPYAKLAKLNAKVLCLGVPPITNTMFHCAEDILQKRFPAAIYPGTPKVLAVEDASGMKLHVECFRPLPRWQYACSSEGLLKYFSGDIIDVRTFRGIECSITYASRFLDRLLWLAENRNIHIYRLLFPEIGE